MNMSKILSVIGGVALGIFIKDVIDIPKKSKQAVEDTIKRKSEFMARVDQKYNEEQNNKK